MFGEESPVAEDLQSSMTISFMPDRTCVFPSPERLHFRSSPLEASLTRKVKERMNRLRKGVEGALAGCKPEHDVFWGKEDICSTAKSKTKNHVDLGLDLPYRQSSSTRFPLLGYLLGVWTDLPLVSLDPLSEDDSLDTWLTVRIRVFDWNQDPPIHGNKQYVGKVHRLEPLFTLIVQVLEREHTAWDAVKVRYLSRSCRICIVQKNTRALDLGMKDNEELHLEAIEEGRLT
ncbi:unnamed protein product [Cyprideis torosa]|uniref:Uncharacterized protein n=1 Tax=Cyprideis torosa TaxID=163714 RepID=A0A7R8WKK3_9CRUS|nr:unnamed protein product [Cyprideis torosa]CAG0900552.1 unnamed protein product [Cyprideis torosa]